MARRPRLEVEGGLYHLITRGVDRRDIFHSPEDHLKFLNLLAVQKVKLPFYLYAYCLMTNHVHLLVERMADDVGRIMQAWGQACDIAIPICVRFSGLVWSRSFMPRPPRAEVAGWL